jgi:hypothetical protein
MQNYIAEPSQVKEKLAEYGIAIVKNVLNVAEIQSMKDGSWDYLEHITQNFETPINRNDDATWKEFLHLYPKHSMLLQQWGIGHAKYIWDIRQNVNVVDVFAKIWDCEQEDLLTSFDGASCHFPPEKTGRGWYRGNLWLHTDQSYTRNEFECTQSWITAYDVKAGDATLAFMEGSHKYHKDFAADHNITDKSDWYKLNNEQIQYYKEKGCLCKRVLCDAGDMVLWDSRTIHCGIEPMKKRKELNFRNVAYICMMPRNTATPAMIRKKQKAFNEKRTTNHWANRPKIFPVTPRTYGGNIPDVVDVPDVELTELGRRLAGF